jgi:uncharacterized transporter YbjL
MNRTSVNTTGERAATIRGALPVLTLVGAVLGAIVFDAFIDLPAAWALGFFVGAVASPVVAVIALLVARIGHHMTATRQLGAGRGKART